MGRKKKRRSARNRAAEQAAHAGEPQPPVAPSGQATPVDVTAEPAAAGPAEPSAPAPPPAPTTVPPPPALDPPAESPLGEPPVVAAPPAPQSLGVAAPKALAPKTTPALRPESGDPVVDLDADLDADLDGDASDSYDSLVAQVAGLKSEPRRPKRGAARAPRKPDPEPPEDVVEVHDLDDDEGASNAVHRLIAQAVVGAPPEEVEPEAEAPLIDLDADEDQKVPPARSRSPGVSPPTSPPPSRLVQAAAFGGVDDDEPAISLDFGEVSTPEARARLLAEALAHAEHKEARYRVPLTDTRRAARWKALVSGVLFVLAGSVAVAPPGWVRPEPMAQLNDAARARGTRMALLLQAQQVEAFRVRSQRLPESLRELPAALPGMRYARSGNRAYQLIAYERDGNAIVFDSANPAPAFRILMSAWAPAEEAP